MEEIKDEMGFFSGGGWVYWLMEKKKNILMALPLVLVVAFFGGRLAFKNQSGEADFAKAHTLFSKWEASRDSESLAALISLIKKHPELEGRYDDLVAQSLIAKEEFSQALPMALRALERSKGLTPYWHQFATTTLTVGEGAHQEALTQALGLKEELLSRQEEGCDYLFALNLMRIASLYSALGDGELELKSWKDLKDFGQKRSGAFERLVGHFTNSNISLLDYIEHRETCLLSALRR